MSRQPASAACNYCRDRHAPRYLCGPAKRVLDALVARGQSFNMPTIEFPAPIPAEELGMGLSADDKLLAQVVVQAATVPAVGVIRPAVIFTGRTVHGEVLPKWLYAGVDDDMSRLAVLVRDMTDLAMRTAAAA
jgi:hypothetical protein